MTATAGALTHASVPLAQSLIEWRIDWSWIGRHGGDIWTQLVQHVTYVAVAIGVGAAISAVLSVIAFRHRRLRRLITGTAGVIYTIPSFALILLLVPFTGLTATTIVIPLILYTLLALIRNTVAGLEGVPADVREAAIGMGYTRTRLLREVEFPLALPVVIAGLRIATVTTVGMVTIGGFLGGGLGGLGTFIFDGLRRFFLTPLLVGAVGTFILAMLLDGLLLLLERALTPWSRRGSTA